MGEDMSPKEKNKINEVWEQAQRIVFAKYKIIKTLTSNTEVIGDYIENVIRLMIRNWVVPYEISRGTILLEGIDRQIDSIIWERQRAPALIEEGNFAVVLADGVKGIIEIRSYCKSKDIEETQGKVKDIVSRVQDYLCLGPFYGSGCGVVIRSPIKDDSLIEKYAKDKVVPVYILFKDIEGELSLNRGMLWELANFVYKKMLPMGGYWRPSM